VISEKLLAGKVIKIQIQASVKVSCNQPNQQVKSRIYNNKAINKVYKASILYNN